MKKTAILRALDTHAKAHNQQRERESSGLQLHIMKGRGGKRGERYTMQLLISGYRDYHTTTKPGMSDGA
jgi:hypothetical protein